MLIGGSPCFVAGTMVRTENGIKPIEQISIGDKVLTHNCRYRMVTQIMRRLVNSTVIVSAENCAEKIECTAEHPFYVRLMTRKFDQNNRKYVRTLSEDFGWLSPKYFLKKQNSTNDIIQQIYLTCATDDIEKDIEYNGVELKVNQHSTRKVNTLELDSEHLWYVIGRWVADGWFKSRYRKNKTLGGIIICCGKHKTEKFEEKLRLAKLKYCKTEEETVCKYVFCNKEFALFLKKFGEYADKKFLAEEVYFLPKKLALAFLSGYFDADGCYCDDTISFSSVSKELAYGIKYLVNKYYKVACSITSYENHNQTICGRIVHTKKVYAGSFKINRKLQSHYFVENNYIMSPYKTVEEINEMKVVYNLSVDEDESYTANGMVVHNCTYWSCAQKNNRETTAEGLGWELFKNYLIAKEKFKPDIFFYENNKSAAKAIKDQIKKELTVWDGIGEDSGARYIEINSALVSAQNRQRFYVHNCGEVGQPEDRHIYLKDILETGVGLSGNEKSYCLTARYDGAIPWNTLERKQREMVAEPINVCQDEKSHTIKAQYNNSSLANFITNGGFSATGVAERIPEYGKPDKSRPCEALYPNHAGTSEGSLEKRLCSDNPNKQQVDLIAEPIKYCNDKNMEHLMRPYGSKGKIVGLDDEKSPTLMAAMGTGGGNGIYYADDTSSIKVGALPRPNGELSTSQAMRIYSVNGKSVAQSAGGGGMGGKTGLYAVPYDNVGESEIIQKANKTQINKVYEVKDGKITIKGKQYPIKLKDGYYIIRKLTVTECCRLQGMPECWFRDNQGNKILSDSQAYKGLGNGWQLDTVKYIWEHRLKDIPKDEEIVVLSMYDGIATGRRILEELGFTNVKYYAYEIDKNCIKLTSYRYPDIIHCGDAFQVRNENWELKQK